MTEGFIRSHIDYSYRDKIPKAEFTKAHIEIFKTHSERWKRDAYSTRRIDKPLARAAIKALYWLEGRAAPFIIWTKSPLANICLLYTSPSPRDATLSRMPSSA